MLLTVVLSRNLFRLVLENLHAGNRNQNRQGKKTPTDPPEDASVDVEHKFNIHTDAIDAVQPAEGERFQNNQHQGGERYSVVVYHVQDVETSLRKLSKSKIR